MRARGIMQGPAPSDLLLALLLLALLCVDRDGLRIDFAVGVEGFHDNRMGAFGYGKILVYVSSLAGVVVDQAVIDIHLDGGGR